jgi:hypothetical protein
LDKGETLVVWFFERSALLAQTHECAYDKGLTNGCQAAHVLRYGARRV